MKRILVTWLDDDEMKHVHGSRRREISIAVRMPSGDMRSVGAAVIVHRGSLEYLSRVEPILASGELRYLVKLSESIPVKSDDLSLDSASRNLMSSQLRPFTSPGGVLSEAATRVVSDNVTGASSAYVEVRSWLADSSRHFALDDVPSLPEQREATLLAAKCAGMDVGHIAVEEKWGTAELNDLFLPPLPGEDALIEHDVRTFLGMRRRGIQIGGARFEDDLGRKLRVYNVNRSAAETHTGADLIYIHERRQSAVFVQYKRMKEEAKDWVYRPDDQYQKQSRAFTTVERRSRRLPMVDPDSFRLSASSCFFKFCRMKSYDLDERSLCHGSYIANDHLQLHLNSDAALGPGGGRRVTQHSCGGGLTNTLFADCVAYGMIGTPPLDLEKLARVARSSTGATRATVLAIFDDPGGRRPGPSQRAHRADGGRQNLI